MRQTNNRHIARTSHSAVLVCAFLFASASAFAQSKTQPAPQPKSEAEPLTNVTNSSSPSTSDAPADPATRPPASLLAPLSHQTQEAPYHPITPRQRLRWFITNTIGPEHMVGGIFTSGFGTALDRPKEYGPHWGGFADRYGMRMTGIVTGNALEATIGYELREDPRYFRVPDQPFKSRMKNVVRLTFMARSYDGSYSPAYARYIAVAGNNFLSNTWRAPSEANNKDALVRTAEGFAGRMIADAFEEFWPDIKAKVFHKHN